MEGQAQQEMMEPQGTPVPRDLKDQPDLKVWLEGLDLLVVLEMLE